MKLPHVEKILKNPTMEDKKKKGFWRHAFAVEKAEDFVPTEEDIRVLDAVCAKVIRHGMALPAILFLESARPMNFVTSQAMAFFEPIIRGVFTSWQGYSDFYKILEKRGSVELLIDRMEKLENERQQELNKLRQERKGKKKAPASETQRKSNGH